MPEYKLLDKILEIFLSKNKIKLYVLFSVIVGFILRLIAAINLDSSADDMNHALKALGIWESGKLTIWDQSNSLYYYLIDFSYKVFGLSQLSSRLPALIFGTASILIMFVFCKEFFKSEKIGLFASFLLAVSPWHIKNTIAEMDVTAMFFVLLAGFFLIRAIGNSEKERKNMIFAGIAIGLGILVKLYVLFFAFSFFIYFLYMKKGDKNKWKNVGVFTLIGFILLIPSVASEYLLYKDKGITGIIPANTLGIGKEKAAEFYSWDASWGKKPDYIGFFTKTAHYDINLPGGLLTLRYLLYADPIIFFLGFFGLFLAYKKARNYFIFFLVSFIPVWFYISSVIPLGKHLLFEVVLFAPLAAFSLNKIIEKFSKVGKIKVFFIIIFIFQLFWLGVHEFVSPVHFYSKSSIGQFIEYKNEKIGKDGFIIFDGRIYRARTNWMGQGRFYLDATTFEQVLARTNEFSSNTIPIKTFFVECARDDCGWGTIKDQPEFNQSMENYVKFFSNISVPYVIEQQTGKFSFPFVDKKEEVFKIYEAELFLKPEILELSKYTHNWYLYPIGYDERYGEIFDKYSTSGIVDTLLNKIAHWIFYIALALAALSILVPFYFFVERESKSVSYPIKKEEFPPVQSAFVEHPDEIEH